MRAPAGGVLARPACVEPHHDGLLFVAMLRRLHRRHHLPAVFDGYQPHRLIKATTTSRVT